MIKKMNDILYRPILFFFLLPLISIIPGTIFSLQYGAMNLVSLMALYIYIIVNQLIENILLRIPTNNFERSKRFLMSLEVVNILLILFFALRYSWISAAILLLYTIIIQLQFLFSYYELEYIAAILASFLKVLLLNSFSFYIQTNFVHFRFTLYYLALFFPYLIYELTRSEQKLNKMVFIALSSLSYILPALLLWSDIRLPALSLLISSPFILANVKETERKYMPTFLIIFSGLYMALILIIFIP